MLVVGLVGADRAVVAGSDDGGVVAAGGFSDVGDGVHGPAIRALEAEGILEGTECGEGLFCAGDPVHRWVMAVWMVRVLDGADPAGSGASRFADVDAGAWWAPFVERLAELGVTAGCATGPLRFCPDEAVTRGQMATFLVRAFGFESGEPAGFVDTDGNTHAGSIDALAAAGVTAGCATDPLRFCPVASVTRGQMATFLVRAQGATPPTDEPAPPGAATYKAVSGACGLLTDDTITCWGNTFYTAIVSPPGTYKSLVTGGDYYCAIAADDTISCWGQDWRGETDPPAGTYKTLSASWLHSCAIATNNTITCWGDNEHGQADAPPGTYKSVVTGDNHNCAIATDGAITCWGNNLNGKAEPPAGAYRTVAAGRGHNCAIATDGSVTCWGAACGGGGCRWMNLTPAGTYEALAAGDDHSCAIAIDGTITCWGNNWNGRATPPSGTYKSRRHRRAEPTVALSRLTAPSHAGATTNTDKPTLLRAPTSLLASAEFTAARSPLTANHYLLGLQRRSARRTRPEDRGRGGCNTSHSIQLTLSGRSMADFVSSDVPAFDMIDVATGDTVNLRSVVHGRTPILLWLYSPY